MNFKDHFSDAPARYAEFRPAYPADLFDWLAGLAPSHDYAWDCATGNGQAASALARHYRRVIATDASAEQIAHACGPDNVDFRVAPAEASGLPASSVNLITVAQAAHWFDLPAFYSEVQRVLKPGGALALWGYGRLILPDSMDQTFQHFYQYDIGAYWPPERALIDNQYRSLDFPFAEMDAPVFFIEVNWTLQRLLDYLSTWSAVKRYQSAHQYSPLINLARDLQSAWGNPDQPIALKWPLFMRVGLLK